MQAGSVLALSPAFNLYSPAAELCEDFGAKLELEAFDADSMEVEYKEELETEALDEKLRDGGENGEEEEEEEDEEEEFSFACANPDGSPISADDAFVDGRIRPMFPLFNQDLLYADSYEDTSNPKNGSSTALRPPLRKLLVEERELRSSSASANEPKGDPTGPYCEWSGKGELNKKSNSTGFSKLWRFRDLVHRSHSDGHDAFVFLHPPSASAKQSSETTTAPKKNDTVEKKKVVGANGAAKSSKTASSAHEKHYVMNRARREGDKRKSYLPYRQGLVGFFTNVNGLSKNVHPF